MCNLKLITKQFIDSNYHELNLSKRFVTTDEINKIKNENNLDEKLLFTLIDDANEEFLNTQRPIVFKKFKSFLSSYNKFIDKKMRSDIWSKFYTNYYDYYHEMHFDDYIDEKNKKYVALKIGKIRKKYGSLLFDGYIDEYKKNCLIQKLKEDDFDFNDGLNINKLIKILNKKHVQKESDDLLKEIKLFLSDQYIINDKIRSELILKYNKTDFKFYDKLNVDKLIIEKNNDKILKEIHSFLLSYDDLITEDMYSKIKLKYNFHFHKFYDELDLENLLDEHNRKNKSKIIKRELTSCEGCIPDSKRLQLNSKYRDVIKWNAIIKNYNDAYENKIAIVDSKSFMYQHFKDRVKLNNMTNKGVFYLHEYYKDSFRKDYEEEKGISDRISKYKNGNNSAINFFTNELIEAIVYLSKYCVNDNIKSLALISIPPASNEENSLSSMRKTICSIKRLFDNGRLLKDYGFNHEIYDYGNLLYRYIKIKPAKLCKFDERPDAEKHIKTILCTKKNFASDDMAFVLMDDITTLGSIMDGCEKILINNGVKKENVYKLAIAYTPRVF